MGYLVHNFGDTTTRADVDLTSVIAAGGGELAGLLNLRGLQHTTDTSPFDATGDLVEVASYVEMIARDLLTRFNMAYLGPDENTATANHESSSGDLSGNVTNTFTGGIPNNTFALFNFTGANNSLTGGADVDRDGRSEQSDLNSYGLFSYANDLQFAITDPAKLAAALDLDPVAGSTSFAPGDGDNLQRLLNERDSLETYNLGSVSVSGTIEELYDITVSYVGGLKGTSSNQLFIAKDRETQVQEAQSNVSGVSLDEEFAQLINYQRAFEASGRMIKVGDELLAQILGLIG